MRNEADTDRVANGSISLRSTTNADTFVRAVFCETQHSISETLFGFQRDDNKLAKFSSRLISAAGFALGLIGFTFFIEIDFVGLATGLRRNTEPYGMCTHCRAAEMRCRVFRTYLTTEAYAF